MRGLLLITFTKNLLSQLKERSSFYQVNQETGFATPKIILHGCCGFIEKEQKLSFLHHVNLSCHQSDISLTWHSSTCHVLKVAFQ